MVCLILLHCMVWSGAGKQQTTFTLIVTVLSNKVKCYCFALDFFSFCIFGREFGKYVAFLYVFFFLSEIESEVKMLWFDTTEVSNLICEHNLNCKNR